MYEKNLHHFTYICEGKTSTPNIFTYYEGSVCLKIDLVSELHD